MDKRVKTASVGGIFFLANALLTTYGCSPELKDCPPQFATAGAAHQKYGVVTDVQEVEPGQFKIIDEYPSKCTGVMVKHINGSVEIIPQQKAEAMVREAPQNDFGLGLGTVLASGMLGYMLGRTTYISSHVYANDGVYRQALARKPIIGKRLGRDESEYSGRGPSSVGGRYGGKTSYGTTSSGTKKGGFFSSLFGGSSG
ncbi:MAG: hypothetical protein HQL01_11910 [Nitrospirae bacterium]|nr:hypothetical protein [Nitrospirota bacterium]